jgi:hypothetical protein
MTDFPSAAGCTDRLDAADLMEGVDRFTAMVFVLSSRLAELEVLAEVDTPTFDDWTSPTDAAYRTGYS